MYLNWKYFQNSFPDLNKYKTKQHKEIDMSKMLTNKIINKQKAQRICSSNILKTKKN